MKEGSKREERWYLVVCCCCCLFLNYLWGQVRRVRGGGRDCGSKRMINSAAHQFLSSLLLSSSVSTSQISFLIVPSFNN